MKKDVVYKYYLCYNTFERKFLASFLSEAVRPKGGVIMNKYEIMFIVKTDIDEKTQKDTVKAFEKVLTDMKSKVINTKDMGQKKLAYPINKQVRGNYYVFNVEATVAAVNEFDRKAKIDENILRHIVIREEE